MSNIDPMSYARQIVQKLDSQDGKSGDNKIEASIWNKFVADKGGNTIKYCITFENAIKSIASYLTNNAKRLGKSVETLANEWLNRPISDNVQKDKSQETYENNQSEKPLDAEKYPISAGLMKEIKERQENYKAEAKRKYEKAKDIADNEKASNGLTYKQAKTIMQDIRNNTVGSGQMFVVDKNGENPHWKILSDEEFIESLERLCSNKGATRPVDQANLANYKKAYAAVKELEEKYPMLKDLEQLRIDATGSLVNNETE